MLDLFHRSLDSELPLFYIHHSPCPPLRTNSLVAFPNRSLTHIPPRPLSLSLSFYWTSKVHNHYFATVFWYPHPSLYYSNQIGLRQPESPKHLSPNFLSLPFQLDVSRKLLSVLSTVQLIVPDPFVLLSVFWFRDRVGRCTKVGEGGPKWMRGQSGVEDEWTRVRNGVEVNRRWDTGRKDCWFLNLLSSNPFLRIVKFT